ncbi:hypothetical protein TNCV_1470341 [Trichonephila clavipes]|nr:hypothetical protein TNCV_1470341 [Trichonephila clavipes]
MVEFHPNFFCSTSTYIDNMSGQGLIEALRQSICLGMIRRCETMINVTQVDERETSLDRKTAPRSVIITEELHA